MTAALQFENLTAGYGGSPVLRDLHMTFEQSQATVLLGANGAGKTTLLRAISGLISRTGNIQLFGESISSTPAEKIAAKGLSHVPQGRGTFSNQTVEDNLLIGSYLRRDAQAVKTEMDQWYETFPILGERRKQKAGNLSGGEQQMLAIARGMMSAPKVLLLDEPSLGLAPKIVVELYQVLARIIADTSTTLILVEQNADLALNLADYVYVLEVGAIAIEGKPEIVTHSEELRAAYLGAQS